MAMSTILIIFLLTNENITCVRYKIDMFHALVHISFLQTFHKCVEN
jgi:hypothetical protein